MKTDNRSRKSFGSNKHT